MKTGIILRLLILGALLLSGCSGDLTRGDAEQLLKSQIKWQHLDMNIIAVTSPEKALNNNFVRLPFLEELSSLGYLKPKDGFFNSGQVSGGAHGCGPINQRPPGLLTCRPHAYTTWQPTEKLKFRDSQAVLDRGGRIQVDLAMEQLEAVTGIAKIGEGTFKVEYTTIWIPTEIGKLAVKHEAASPISNKQKTSSAIVRRYDDGWRLERGLF